MSFIYTFDQILKLKFLILQRYYQLGGHILDFHSRESNENQRFNRNSDGFSRNGDFDSRSHEHFNGRRRTISREDRRRGGGVRDDWSLEDTRRFAGTSSGSRGGRSGGRSAFASVEDANSDERFVRISRKKRSGGPMMLLGGQSQIEITKNITDLASFGLVEADKESGVAQKRKTIKVLEASSQV